MNTDPPNSAAERTGQEQDVASNQPRADDGVDRSDPPIEELNLTEIEAPADPLQDLQARHDELEGRLMRVSADYQNFIRRSEQNTTHACNEQLIKLAKALITPLDHFDRALAVDTETTDATGVLEGVRIVRDELLKALEQFGIRRLEVEAGEEFDPTRHEALMKQPGDGMDAGRVASQLQPGYTLGEATLRPAQVAVTE